MEFQGYQCEVRWESSHKLLAFPCPVLCFWHSPPTLVARGCSRVVCVEKKIEHDDVMRAYENRPGGRAMATKMCRTEVVFCLNAKLEKPPPPLALISNLNIVASQDIETT